MKTVKTFRVINHKAGNNIVHPLTDDTILAASKFKAITDDNFEYVSNGAFLFFYRVGKRRNYGYLYFLLFPQRLQKASFLVLFEVCDGK